MRVRGAVRDGVAGHEDAVAVLQGVDGGRADAAGGRRARDDHRVAARGAQPIIEVGAEERGGEELHEHRLVRPAAEPRVDLDPWRAGAERRECRRLGDEHRRPLEVGLVVGDGGEEDLRARGARGVEEARVAATASSASQARAEPWFVKPSMKSTTTTAACSPAPCRPPNPRRAVDLLALVDLTAIATPRGRAGC